MMLIIESKINKFLNFVISQKKSTFFIDHKSMNPTALLFSPSPLPSPSKQINPADLLSRLSIINESTQQSQVKKKNIQQLEQQLQFYESYCMSSIQNLRQKLNGVNEQVSQLKKAYNRVENEGMAKFDSIEKKIEQVLEDYDRQRIKGEQMVKELVQNVQEQLQQQIVKHSLKSSKLIQSYLQLNTRIQQSLESLSIMQSNILQQYSSLRAKISSCFSSLEYEITHEIQQDNRNHLQLIAKIQMLEKQCQQQIISLNQKKQAKNHVIHQFIDSMVQHATKSSQLSEEV